MKRIFALLIAFCLASILKVSAQVIYNVNFATQQPVGWGYSDDTYHTSGLTGGRFIVTHKQSSYTINTVPVTIDYTRDFYIETTASQIAGVTNFPFGITFAGSDFLNLYYFTISSSGYYLFRATNQGKPVDVKTWTQSSAIRTGAGAVNTLRVAKIGAQCIGYINGVEVMRTQFYQPFGNQVGVLVQDKQTIAFNNFTVAYSDSKPIVNNQPPQKNTSQDITTRTVKTTTQPAMSIIEMAYNTTFAADDANGWVLAPTDSVKTSIANSEFLINRTAKSGYTGSVTVPQTRVDMSRDFVIETDAYHYSGTDNYGFGIEFGCDSTQEYQFAIASAGYYSLTHITTKKVNSMIPWTATDAVLKGNGAKNKLTIEKKGGKLNFYINDNLVDSYPAIAFTGYQFGVMAAANQRVGFNTLRFGYTDQKQTQKVVQNQNTGQKDVTAPVITISQPTVTRGLKIVKNTDKIQVIGKATDPAGIFQVVVNGVQAKVDAQGNFTADVELALGDNPLMVVATDMNMNKSTTRFSVTKEAAAQGNKPVVEIPRANEGKFYALLIAEQDYKDASIPSLDGPIKDAGLLAAALKSGYTFDAENVTVVNNATREAFFDAFDALAKKVTANDNVIIFYAGHGNWDETRMQGYWYPSDAKLTRRDTWITNDDLIGLIRGIKSKHTLLITDACFAGGIFKTRGIEAAPKGIQELYNTPSRKAMTSGAMKEVPDKSVFIEYLVKRLTENTEKYLPSDQLYTSFRIAVTNNSENAQMPQFGVITQTGDEGGDFIFIKR